MKTPKSFYILALLVFVLTAGMNCKDKLTFKPTKEELPRATQEGRNTFGFLLNGEVWLPKSGLLRGNRDLSYNSNTGSFNIIARRNLPKENINMFLAAGASKVFGTGTYDLFISFSGNNCTYEYKPIPVGEISITKIDFLNKFISGTFKFKLEKQGCQPIYATEGRFDLKM